MKPWIEQPFEIRNLFNPAFCGLTLARAIEEYQSEASVGMPYSLSLLVLPLSLHKNSRKILTQGNRSYLLKLIENSPELKIDFPRRATYLLPFAQRGFSLLAEHKCLHVSESGHISIIENTIRKTITGTNESRECQKAAKYLGRQFARISDRMTIYSSLGVRP